MRSVPVVTVEPGLEMLLAVGRVLIDGGVSPLAQAGLDKAFGFAVGARGVGSGEDVFDARAFAGRLRRVVSGKPDRRRS